MTCIVAVKNTKGRLYVGADRRLNIGDTISISPLPKVIKREGIILAGCGYANLSMNLCHYLYLPPRKKLIETDTYVHEILHEQIKKYILRKGISKNKELSVEETHYAEIVLGIDNRLFSIEIEPPGIVSIIEVSTPFATGSGGDVALGSLRTYLKEGFTNSKEILIKALEVASEFNSACDDNIDIENL